MFASKRKNDFKLGNGLRWALTHIGFVLSTFALVFAPPRVQAAPAVPLHTAGPYIVDSNGNRVRFNAVNWYGAEGKDYVVMGLQSRTLPEIVNEIKTRGFNAVRLPWSNEMYQSNPVVPHYALTANPSLDGKDALVIFDAVVNELTKAGIMVILDNHVSTAMWCCTNDVNNLWYNTTYTNNNWISDWKGMALRYADNPMVVGGRLAQRAAHIGGLGRRRKQ